MGSSGDVESIASLTGIRHNLLPYWLTRYPDHELANTPDRRSREGAPHLRRSGDEMARKVFEQQAMAIGRLFTIAANFTDPNAYFVGGGVVEAAPEFRDWYLSVVRTQHAAARRSNSTSPSSRWSPTSTWPGLAAHAVAARSAFPG